MLGSLTRPVALFAAVGALLSAPAVASAAPDPERDSVAAVDAWYPAGPTVSRLNADFTNRGRRTTDLEVDSVGLSAALQVRNTGTFARTPSRVIGPLSLAALGQSLQSSSSRIVDLEQSGSNYYAATVPNSGVSEKRWWYYLGVSRASLNNAIVTNNGRLIDLDQTGSDSYNAVMVANAGEDQKTWWFYYDQSPSQISALLETNKARLFDLDAAGNGRFNAVMVPVERKTWYWFVGTTLTDLVDRSEQLGTRLIHVERYTDARGRVRWAGVLLRNVGSETSRLQAGFESRATGGRYGVLIKPVGGTPLASLRAGTVFEPASAIKVVHHLWATRRVERGVNFLDDPVAYRNLSGSCPTGSFVNTTSLDVADRGMMNQSDNRYTEAIARLAGGNANLQAFTAANGLDDTKLRQTIGCGWNDRLRNDWTLNDAGSLYEQVQSGEILSTTAGRTRFWDTMLGGTGADSGLRNLIVEEATALGKAGVVDDFTSRVTRRFKDGSYNLVCDEALTGAACDGADQYRVSTYAGRFTLPFKNAAGGIDLRSFVGGVWAEKLLTGCTTTSNCDDAVTTSDAAKFNSAYGFIRREQFRAAIRSALLTW